MFGGAVYAASRIRRTRRCYAASRIRTAICGAPPRPHAVPLTSPSSGSRSGLCWLCSLRLLSRNDLGMATDAPRPRNDETAIIINPYIVAAANAPEAMTSPITRIQGATSYFGRLGFVLYDQHIHDTKTRSIDQVFVYLII